MNNNDFVGNNGVAITKKSILILKLGALGDVLRTTFLPALYMCKYPSAEITWVTDYNAVSMLKGHPNIQRVIAFQNTALRDALKRESFDLVISLDDEREVCAFASSLQTKELHGAYLAEDGALQYTASVEPWFGMGLLRSVHLGGKQQADQLKTANRRTFQDIFTSMFGLSEVVRTVADTRPILHLTLDELNVGHAFLEQHNLLSSRLIIGINAGAGSRWQLKWLSEEKTAALADMLVQKYSATVLLLGGIDETERNKRIHQLCKEQQHVVFVQPTLSIRDFASIINVCDLVIASDSLALHISLALQKQTVAFFGPTSPWEIEMFGLGKKVYKEHPCLCCYRKDIFPDNCIEQVQVMDLLAAVEKTVKL